MIDRIADRYIADNINRIRETEIVLRSKKVIQGYKVNNDFYMRVTKAGLRAISFKSGRFVKIPKNIFKK